MIIYLIFIYVLYLKSTSTDYFVLKYKYKYLYLDPSLCRESEVLDGVGVGLLRILGVGIFDPTPTPEVQFNYFSTCFACLFLPAAQASSS